VLVDFGAVAVQNFQNFLVWPNKLLFWALRLSDSEPGVQNSKLHVIY
jgi:hypothetical protein